MTHFRQQRLLPLHVLCAYISALNGSIEGSGPGLQGTLQHIASLEIGHAGWNHGRLFPSLSPLVWPCRIIHGGALGTMIDTTLFMTAYCSANAVFTGTMTITFKRSVSFPGFQLGVS